MIAPSLVQANTPYSPPSEGFVRLPNVAAMTGMAKSTIWEKSKKGTFPKPVKLSERITGWRVEEIRAWMADPKAWALANGKGE